ncbi:hypothetical protein RB195_017918 [Necator americanus]|uniref:Uncharacterized protein n=2 Tax=Necator americanus TaxID=51031 RepID=A0ABR1C7B7_NECAM
MESLATTIRFVTLNCRTLSSELQEAALSRLLRYLCVPFAALQKTRMRDRPVISIEDYTIYSGDADEKIDVRNDYNNLVEEFRSSSSSCSFVRLQNRRERHGIGVNAELGFEQQFKVLGKRHYPPERLSDNDEICEQTGLTIASTFKRNHQPLPSISSRGKGRYSSVKEEPPTQSEEKMNPCIQKMRNGKSGGDDGATVNEVSPKRRLSMNAILLVLTLLVVDTLSFEKTSTSDYSETGAIDFKRVRKTLNMKKHKFSPLLAVGVGVMVLIFGVELSLPAILKG